MQRTLISAIFFAILLTFAACGSKKAVTVDDVLPEAMYEAFGNEPYWNARVTKDGIYVTMMGDEPMEFPLVESQKRGSYTVYETKRKKKGKETSIRLAFAHQSCEDNMSGTRYPYSVNFTIDGDQYKGCGNGPGY